MCLFPFRSGLSVHLLQSGGGWPACLLLCPDSIWFPAGSGLPQICRRDRKWAQSPSGTCQLPALWPGVQTFPEESKCRGTYEWLDIHRVSVIPGQWGWQSSSSTTTTQPPWVSTLRRALSFPRDPPKCSSSVCWSQGATPSTTAQPQSWADSSGNQPAATTRTNPTAPEWWALPACRSSQTLTLSIPSASAD